MVGLRHYGQCPLSTRRETCSPDAVQDVAPPAPAGSLTVLGTWRKPPVRGATRPGIAFLQHLPEVAAARHAELTLGYSRPRPDLDLASRLLPVAAPTVAADPFHPPGSEGTP